MKKTFLFCTKIWFYLSEIPPLVLMIFAIIYNKNAEGGVGLYPLILFSAAAAIMIFIYFYRLIIISNEEIRSAGLFSSRESAVIEKDTKLRITMEQGKALRIELLGKAKTPDFTWMKNDDYIGKDISIYREKAIGGKKAVTRVLGYFGVTSNDINEAYSNSFSKEYDYFTFSSLHEEKTVQITLSFTKTI